TTCQGDETTKARSDFQVASAIGGTFASTRVRRGIGAHSTAGTRGDHGRGSTGSAATSTITAVSRGGRGRGGV
ncbi:hypothetical protein MKX01_004208, partial [Papaver californicum]